MSYARQGIDREPTIHLGAKVRSLEDRGLVTDRVQGTGIFKRVTINMIG